MKAILSMTMLFVFLSASAVANTVVDPVAAVFGRPGLRQGNVTKFTFPRTDLKVRIGDVVLSPALALTSWAAFAPSGGGSMVMGDLVLTPAEVPRVIPALLHGGLQITALHNHLLGESPPVMYLHFAGHGDAQALARALKAALRKSATPLGAPARAAKTPPHDWSSVERIFGKPGQRQGNVIQFSFPRRETMTESGQPIPIAMGVATAVNLEAHGKDAVAAGDFVLRAAEIQRVAAALTAHGIAVVALHNHMLSESPRLFFMHFWGEGSADALARGLKVAIDETTAIRRK